MSLTPEIIKGLDDQVREIARHLGMEFDQEYAKDREENWNYAVELKQGSKRLSVITGGYKQEGRFVIRAIFPRDKKGQSQTGYNVKTPEITAAMDRGPEKIARAIQSRLLPEYEKQLAIALERIEKSDAYHKDRLQTLKIVAEYFGQPVPEDDKPIYPNLKNPDGTETGERGIYKIEVCSEDRVTFTVTCSVGKAIKIFDILKENNCE